ncbi:hypothetical protein K8352_02370 [Flavobacteriaceae bacterium F89]|uniref:Uncharacterized protein n=1 Tax=Cerina litoralis TaxID=2874477 RepID=A0AAE3ESW8_9FLAO|nr:hypothetical protein [Cerina litoralis]MCG2459589.1 hypothetical protein [Cerina litoralis]
MEELELLKRDWKKKEGELPRLSYTEIYQMILKKSTSIVKWIFYISIIEFVFWTTLNIITSDSGSWEQMRSIHTYYFMIGLTVLSYVVLVYFIYKFYTNYKRISFTDSSKRLMKTILDTKRTVTQYVWFNLSIFMVSLLGMMYGTLRYGTDGERIQQAALQTGHETLFWIIVCFLCLISTAVFLGLLWLFYRLLYGILLKKLRQNYNELGKMEV